MKNQTQTKAYPSQFPRRSSVLKFLTLALSAAIFSQVALRADDRDDKIEAAANASYVFKTFLKDDAITTASKEGVVTLTGTVMEESHKLLAQDTVIGLPGVVSVENKIEVKNSPPEHSDTWLYLKVKSALAYHRSVSAYATQVELKEGVVTLKGAATSQTQKDLAEEYAKDIEGVKSVKNKMTIVSAAEKPTIAEMIDDASISAQVRMVLLAHLSTSSFKTSIHTSEGIVTVTGSAKNLAEKSQVTRLVSDIHGVKSVVNNMTVQVTTAAP